MTETEAVRRKQIEIGNDKVEIVQLPDGSYRFNLWHLAKMLKIEEHQLLHSLRSASTNPFLSNNPNSSLLKEVIVTSSQGGTQGRLWTVAPEGLVILLQYISGTPAFQSFVKALISISIEQFLDNALREPAETETVEDRLVWQAYLDSEKEREEVYHRLASS